MQHPTLNAAAKLMAEVCESPDSPELLIWYAGESDRLDQHERELAALNPEQLRLLVQDDVTPAGAEVSEGCRGWLEAMALLANGLAYTSKTQAEQIAAKKAELAAQG